MSSLPHRIAVGILLAVVTACSSGGSPSQPAPTPNPSPTLASLSGVIVDANTQQPAAAARVEVVQGVNEGAAATADAQGRYRLDNLQPGTFTILAQAVGFESASQAVTLAGSQTLNFTLRASAGGGPGVSGFVIDGVSDRGLPGVLVRIDGLGETTTDIGGRFMFPSADPQQPRPVTLTSGATVERATRLRVPGPDAIVSLMPASFNLAAFNEMFRGTGQLHRWVDAPRLVVQRRALQFSTATTSTYKALDAVMADVEVAALIADLEWALSQLTGGRFHAFASHEVELAGEGDDVEVAGRPGAIIVGRFVGLTSATTFWGLAHWSWNNLGELQAGILKIDHGFDTSNSPYRRSLRAHELGHTLGYRHVTVLNSVMRSHARTEPTQFDRDGARLAFQRPPGNRPPDIDPDPFVGNFATQIFWASSH
jgi:hypothetical protein